MKTHLTPHALIGLGLSLAMAACSAAPQAAESSESSSAAVSTGQEPAPDLPIGGRVPVCPEGEKMVCTLGPPPVCHCEPVSTGVGLSAP
jgi:hypothetical protein